MGMARALVFSQFLSCFKERMRGELLCFYNGVVIFCMFLVLPRGEEELCVSGLVVLLEGIFPEGGTL